MMIFLYIYITDISLRGVLTTLDCTAVVRVWTVEEEEEKRFVRPCEAMNC